MRKKKGVSLGDALGELSERLDKRSGGGLSQTRAANAWSKVAGETVLSHTTGAHLREGELFIYVDSPAWATELSALSEKYREAIEQEIGQGRVRAVRFSVSVRADKEKAFRRLEEQVEEFYRPDTTPAVPLTEQERAQVEASAAVIPDKELREAVVRATVADLEWKKGIAAAKRREEPLHGF